jgi:hypothetical protein
MLWTGLVLCAAAVLETPPFYLRRVRFEPKQWTLPVSFKLAERLDEARAREAAGRVRQQLVEQGYVEAKVEARLVAVDVHQADLVLRVEPGPLYRRKTVRFTGDLGMEAGELRRAMRGSRPGDLEADLARLRTLYLSRGYAEARVRAAVEGREQVEVAVEAGPRGEARPNLCGCLRAARRLTWDTESEYVVGRIEFRGHHRIGDSTLRREFLLAEGDPFDRERLRRSVERLDASVREDFDIWTRQVRLTVTVREGGRGRWSVSGPLSPWGRPSASIEYAVGAKVYVGLGWSLGPRVFVMREGGFYWSPQGGWAESLAVFGFAQARRALGSGRVRAEEMMAPMEGRPDPILCETRPSRWRWLLIPLQ